MKFENFGKRYFFYSFWNTAYITIMGLVFYWHYNLSIIIIILFFRCGTAGSYGGFIEPVDLHPVLPVQLTSGTSVRYVYIEPVDLYSVL